MPKPTIDQQLDFIRGARHLVANGKRKVEVTSEHSPLLLAIEERLLEVKLYEEMRQAAATSQQSPLVIPANAKVAVFNCVEMNSAHSYTEGSEL